jgi:hypothetical protein
LRQESGSLSTVVMEHRDGAKALKLKLAGRAAASGT